MQKIRVFEAFAGYGSQAMAAKRLQRDFPGVVEFEFVGISEIDPNAVKAYGAVHGGTPNFGDISEIDWDGVPGFVPTTPPPAAERREKQRNGTIRHKG